MTIGFLVCKTMCMCLHYVCKTSVCVFIMFVRPCVCVLIMFVRLCGIFRNMWILIMYCWGIVCKIYIIYEICLRILWLNFVVISCTCYMITVYVFMMSNSKLDKSYMVFVVVAWWFWSHLSIKHVMPYVDILLKYLLLCFYISIKHVCKTM